MAEPDPPLSQVGPAAIPSKLQEIKERVQWDPDCSQQALAFHGACPSLPSQGGLRTLCPGPWCGCVLVCGSCQVTVGRLRATRATSHQESFSTVCVLRGQHLGAGQSYCLPQWLTPAEAGNVAL